MDVRRKKRQALLQKYKFMVHTCLGGICVRCGFDDIRALQVDHINGGGNRHKRERREARKRGEVVREYYRTLLDDKDLTTKYQLLCANCNAIKRVENDENSRA